MSAALWLALACTRTTPSQPQPAAPPAAAVEAVRAEVTSPTPGPAEVSWDPWPRRVVAIGDLHADLPQTLAVLQLAGLSDAEGHWVGGEAVLVQTGDQTDRGPDSKEVLELLMRLQGEAAAAGGEVIVLLGNHEVMNLTGDWRYVSEGDVADFGSVEARQQAFSAQGTLGAWLRERPMVAQVGDTVFVHGGITPGFAKLGVESMNALAAGVVQGRLPPSQLGTDSPIWYRDYVGGSERACLELQQALGTLGARRMVVGHTTQRTGVVAERCGGALLGIDLGISSHYGGKLGVVEFREGDAWALYPSSAVDVAEP